MLRVLITVVVVGGLGLAGSVVWRDPNLRLAMWQQAGALLDEALGIHGPRKDRSAKPAAQTVVQKPSVVTQKPLPVVTAAPATPAYVDRSPTPTSVERVHPKDKKWLDDVIAAKAEKR